MEELVTGYVEAIDRLQALTPRVNGRASLPRRHGARKAATRQADPCRFPPPVSLAVHAARA